MLDASADVASAMSTSDLSPPSAASVCNASGVSFSASAALIVVAYASSSRGPEGTDGASLAGEAPVAASVPMRGAGEAGPEPDGKLMSPPDVGKSPPSQLASSE